LRALLVAELDALPAELIGLQFSRGTFFRFPFGQRGAFALDLAHIIRRGFDGKLARQ